MQNCKTPERITQLGILLVDWEGDGGGYWRTFNRHLNKGNSKFVLLIPLPFLIPYPQMVKKKKCKQVPRLYFFHQKERLGNPCWDSNPNIHSKNLYVLFIQSYLSCVHKNSHIYQNVLYYYIYDYNEFVDILVC